MARKRRIRSTRPVGASLDPETMLNYINEYYAEQGERAKIANELQDVEIQDPLKRQEIRETGQRAIGQRGQALAERGLSARGISAGDISDIERSRVMATQEHESNLRTVRARATAAIADLNARRTALDKNYAAIAGRSIKAGTGRFAGRKPKGWTPPSLPSTAATPPPTVGQPGPAESRPPTGARLQTTQPKKAVNYAKLAASVGARGGFTRRRRVRVA